MGRLGKWRLMPNACRCKTAELPAQRPWEGLKDCGWNWGLKAHLKGASYH